MDFVKRIIQVKSLFKSRSILNQRGILSLSYYLPMFKSWDMKLPYIHSSKQSATYKVFYAAGGQSGPPPCSHRTTLRAVMAAWALIGEM
jgi:hypothetical protein